VQGVASGGVDQTTEYGATWDYTINLDLMRMGILPGALIRFRAESRYGDSVNLAAGPILPVNTASYFQSRPDRIWTLVSPSRTLVGSSFFRRIWVLFLAKLTRWTAIPTSSPPAAVSLSS
jgi:hypothetical protein